MSTAVVAAYVRSYNRLRLLTGAQIAALWDQLGGLDDASLEAFVSRATPLIAGAETATARLTIGYLATLTGGKPAALNLRQIIGEHLRGVDPNEVLARPTITARTAIAAGKTFDQAMALGRTRATTLAQANVMLTQRKAAVATFTNDQRIVGYRRVLTGSSCTLCATVSTQRYHKAYLMPVHDHCDCGIAPIFGTQDPGRVINSDLLSKLKTDPTAVHTHGELGPVLTRKGDHFTGPSDI